VTTAPAPISASLPIVIGPMIIAPGPISIPDYRVLVRCVRSAASVPDGHALGERAMTANHDMAANHDISWMRYIKAAANCCR
jgi:hypothetical protein